MEAESNSIHGHLLLKKTLLLLPYYNAIGYKFCRFSFNPAVTANNVRLQC